MAYPDERNLTEVATLKEWLGIADEEASSDDLFEGLISRSSSIITKYLNVDFLLSRSYTDTLNGNGKTCIQLNVNPISSVDSITIDGESIPARTSFTTSGFYYDTSLIYVDSYTFTKGVSNVSVVYTAGYASNDMVWSVLEQACIELCNFKWKRKDHPDQVWQDLGKHLTAKFTVEGMPYEVAQSINHLRRVTPKLGKTIETSP